MTHSNKTENSIFEELFNQHYQPLYKLAYNLSGSHHYAEDIVQEAFIKAFSGWKNFRNESSPYTWLYKITLHCAYRHIRKTQIFEGTHGKQVLPPKTGKPVPMQVMGSICTGAWFY